MIREQDLREDFKEVVEFIIKHKVYEKIVSLILKDRADYP